ncbi:MAG: TonB-dependent receptor [Limnobacter sp.]|nr:TonB-dependent receptor [Limnobacter sp.]
MRLNALYSDRDVPAREGSKENRNGLALALSHRATDKLLLSADVYHLRANGVPDGGVPWDSLAGQPVPGSHFYGQNARDFLHAGADILTLGLNYDLPDGSHIQNQTRYGITTNEYFITIPGLSAINPATGQQVARTTPVGLATAGVFAAASSQNRNQENKYFGNQTNWVKDTTLNGIEHNLVLGVEVSREEVDNLPYSDALRSPNAGDPQNPNNNAWIEQGGSYTSNPDRYSRILLETWSVYALDTARLNSDWEVFGGLRYDTFDYSLYSGPSDYQNGTQVNSKDGFMNGHLGVTYSPWYNGNAYASVSTSSNPSGEQLDAGANCAYGGLCGDGSAKPERNRSVEIGTKWNLMNNTLLLTSALFQTTKSDVLSQQGAGGPITQVGELRVRGFELGAVGKLNQAISISSGLALLDTEITQSDTDSEIGQAFPNTAEQSANLQLRWQATPKWALGSTATYTGKISGGTPNGPVTSNSIPGNTRYDLMAEYKLSHDVKFRLNVLNATDKIYYDALYRSGAPFTYVGEGRSASLTMVMDF